MPAARHFLPLGTLSDAQLREEIKADIAAALRSQRELEKAGQRDMARRMARAAEGFRQELAAVNNGTWRPERVG